MSHELIHARVLEHLERLRLGHLVERLDVLLAEAARTEPTYLDFLDALLREEMGAKQRKRIRMGVTIAHFPAVKTLEDFDFKAQLSVDQRLVRELATGRFIAQAENVLLFGPPGVGKTHLAIGLGRAGQGRERGNSQGRAQLLRQAQAAGGGRAGLPALREAQHPPLLPVGGASLREGQHAADHQPDGGGQWGSVFGDDVLAAAILDRLLHHSHTLLIQGESYRLRQKKKAGLLSRGVPQATNSATEAER
ncbi:ATP-binding protein, partial [Archangium violaceum]|uniref:ATP-binding protein n=1 Tax=Archangium violaceum TaxID=83451 RepID=UPI003C7B1FBF